ncbi:Na+/H+ antiporter subunit D [Chlorobium sp. N1]|uniref:Na+/H+ antiporter subunit D n=1 Tax=Chlorobium sp. N1 TaxID=2491138 RepID=UPI00103A3A5C|nr:Na+/H+ antiporter subunit D [Chlorobium sp. N1]TCD48843.1 Na+/H+ antiporter subunit D [Chlorobium sp. N1]
MSILPILPVLIPFAAAILMLLLANRTAAHRALNLFSTLLLAAASGFMLQSVVADGPMALRIGGWDAPFAIAFVADTLSAVMTCAAALIGLTTAIYSLGAVDKTREHHFYHPLLQLLLMGVNGAFLTGDVFNLYVWFEVMLISSFVLLVLGSTPRQLEGAIKYVTLNLLSSAIFLAATGMLYGMAGTLNMADLALRIPHVEHRELMQVVSVLFLVTFGVKAALFPLFFWLPASYHTPPVAVSAMFAGLLTKVGVYALIRFFTTIFTGEDAELAHRLLLWTGGFTMVTGVLGAVAQYDVRKLLSFHIISQIGYMVFAVAIHSPLAVAGGLFYMLHNIAAKTNLFYMAGIMKRLGGSYDLRRIGGLYRPFPLLGLLFLVPALGLAGIPPLSGFWAKLLVIRAAMETGHWTLAGIALGVGMLTLFSMIKIWNEGFWKEHPDSGHDPADSSFHDLGPEKQAMMIAPVVMLALVTVAFGFWFEPVFALVDHAARELLDPARYIAAALGGAQ